MRFGACRSALLSSVIVANGKVLSSIVIFCFRMLGHEFERRLNGHGNADRRQFLADFANVRFGFVEALFRCSYDRAAVWRRALREKRRGGSPSKTPSGDGLRVGTCWHYRWSGRTVSHFAN